jgi:predicted DNA-binding transcriptional regulator AlpA
VTTRLLTMQEVAERLAHGYDWFRRQRARLERDEGFPAPVRGCGNRWDPRAIEQWLDRQREPQVNMMLRADFCGDPAEVAARLDSRAVAIGRRYQ